MKELYKSPVLNLLSLQPAERLASNEELDFDKDLGGSGDGSVGGGGIVYPGIDVPTI